MSKNANTFTLATTLHDQGELLVVGKKPGEQEFTAMLGYMVRP
jgi:hypothetical protein